MIVYVDGVEPVDVEQLSIDEARREITRLRAELAHAYNSVHAASARYGIAEVQAHIEWLESESVEARLADDAAEHVVELWADYDMGIPL